MSGDRVLLAHRIKLLADLPIVGPDENSILLSAPAATKLGNNPCNPEFTILNITIPNGSGAVNLACNAVTPFVKYYDSGASTYDQTINTAIAATKARINCKQLKGRINFTTFGLMAGALVAPIEVTVGLHGTDNLGNTWDKTAVILYNVAAGAAGKTISLSFPVSIPYNAARTWTDWYASCDNPAAVGLGLSGSVLMAEVDQ